MFKVSYKVSYQELKKKGEANMTEAEFLADQEIQELEEKLSPRPKYEFGKAIWENTCRFELGVEDYVR